LSFGASGSAVCSKNSKKSAGTFESQSML